MADLLDAAGKRLYLVGGIVRGLLAGRALKRTCRSSPHSARQPFPLASARLRRGLYWRRRRRRRVFP